jgi:hypothetical protein
VIAKARVLEQRCRENGRETIAPDADAIRNILNDVVPLLDEDSDAINRLTYDLLDSVLAVERGPRLAVQS